MLEDIDLNEQEIPTNLIQIKKKIEKVEKEKNKDQTKINPKDVFGKLFNLDKKKKKKLKINNKKPMSFIKDNSVGGY
tara:strand:- start:1467 stop:1697 length:231 start_codon:yes stop_codon:yes gene_type:complete